MRFYKPVATAKCTGHYTSFTHKQSSINISEVPGDPEFPRTQTASNNYVHVFLLLKPNITVKFETKKH